MPTFKQLFSKEILFNVNAPYNQNFVISIFLVFILMIIAGALTYMALKKISNKIPPYDELKNRMMSLFLTTGSIGILLAFFEWQAIPYLSMKFLVFILFLVFIIWSIFILIYIKRDFSRELDKFKQDERYKKYLPRQKRR